MAQNPRPYDAAAAERSIMQFLPSSQHRRQNHSASMMAFGGNGAPPAPHVAGQQQQQQLLSPPASGRSMPQQTAGSSAGGEQLKQSFYNPYHVKHRRRTTKEQLSLLEGTFEHTPKPSSELRKSLASNLCMTAREVQIWFQNRRAKQKNINMRATSATKTSADCSPVLSPADTSLPSDKLERAGSAEHPAAVTAKETQRRHSDIPAPFIRCEAPLGVATCGPIESQLAAAAAALLPSTAMVATMPATAHIEPSPPPALATQAPTYSSQGVLFQQALNAAVAAAASSSSMPCTMPTHHPPPPPLPQPPKHQYPHKKHKHSAGGSGSNTDRYHTARVHQEAFDGTNKLPLKPDDLSPHSAEDQFSILDPSNLPMFMMPMHGGGPNMMGGSNSSSSMGYPSSGHQSLSMPGSTNLGAGGSSMYWNMPYAAPQQRPGLTASSSMPSTDMSTLFSDLLGLSPTSPYSSMQPPPVSPFGLPAVTGSSSNVSDMPAYNADPASSFYQTLLYLTQQGAAAPGATGMPPALGHQHSSNSQLRRQQEMSPLSPAESGALASSPPGSHRQAHLSVDTSAATLMSPPVVPSSAFAPYETQGHAKNQMPSLHQHQHQVAMFMPSGTTAAAASAVYPHLVSIASTDAAEMFGPVSGGNVNAGGNGRLL
ncbi:hypothetical protein IWW39_001740 [Coemansia spiralis]|uniref:Homeobox domain-containing protein n=1 Tax=Coemansia spiralis TaxID=417178 RepID=A0A9W8GLV6_9FUNG|nr:hypothetical protein IWW39_001740 [Coemansia spiralis]